MLTAEENARQRRKNPHPAHCALATALGEFSWLKFDCEDQAKVGPYFPDFRFPECGLIVEIDGSHHDEAADKLRDEHLGWNDYAVLHFASDRPTEEIVQAILGFVAKNAWLCHHCRTEPRTGKRFCTTCGQVKQDRYRISQLGMAPKHQHVIEVRATQTHTIKKSNKQYTLWPACRDCSGTGWVPVEGKRGVTRCACRKQQPLRFDDELARDRERKAQEAFLEGQRIAAPQMPAEEYEQFRLRMFTLLKQTSMNQAVGMKEPQRADRNPEWFSKLTAT